MKILPALLLSWILPLSVASAQRPANQPVELGSRRGAQFDARAPQGLFDLITYVDGEAIVYIKDTNLHYLLLSGAPLQDAGSNYTQPIPQAVFGEFNLEKIAGRGTVTLVEEPRSSNQYNAIVRINDTKAGRDLYHIRLTWTWNPSNPSRPPQGRGYSEPLGSRDNRPDRYDRDREGEFRFEGRVDGVTVLHIHADQVRSEVLNGRAVRDQKFRFSQPLPTANLREIEIIEALGRGKIELVEKPWEGNRYTAVIRITDNSPGDGFYSFKLAWRR